jgi:alkylation response protein AidB-like acyl-CoA dehydrogenase
MDLKYSEDDHLFLNSIERALASCYNFDRRAAHLKCNDGFNRDIWRLYSDLGWLSLCLPEQYGGLGLPPAQRNLLMECMGRKLTLEPYATSVVFASELIISLASPQQCAQLLSHIADGSKIFAVAHHEKNLALNFDEQETIAVQKGNKWNICGRKILVMGGPAADILFVSAKINKPTGELGFGVFLLDRDAPGLLVNPTKLVDDRAVAELYFENVIVDESALIGGCVDGLGEFSLAFDHTLAASCAEAIGSMAHLLSATIDYCSTRKQFGNNLISFQAVQHRIAEMTVVYEEARSASIKATLQLNLPASIREKSISLAKYKTSTAYRYIAQQAVQLHGAMGVTEELSVSAYLKRAIVFEYCLGTSEQHLQRYSTSPSSRDVLLESDIDV